MKVTDESVVKVKIELDFKEAKVLQELLLEWSRMHRGATISAVNFAVALRTALNDLEL